MGDSLNLGKVRQSDRSAIAMSAPRSQTPVFPDNVVEAMAILTIHGGMEKDENGVGEMTIRQLCETCAPRLDGLLREYVCAFGQHGKTVISRYVGMLGKDNPGVDVAVLEQEFNHLVDVAVKEFKPMAAKYIQEHPKA